MNDINNLIIWLILLILCSGFFSATETAYSSINKIKLKNLANNDNIRAKKTLKLADNFPNLISTILIGNNVVNIVATALATLVFTRMYGQDLGVTYSTIFMTLLVLIFGEITPKNIAKERPESFAMAVYPIINILVKLLTPVNFVFRLWSNLISNLFRFQDEYTNSNEELMTMVEEAQNEGDLAEHESDLIINAIEFGESEVKEVFTPRVDVIAINISSSNETIEQIFRENGFSRLPVFENNIDNIVGVLHDKDFYYLNYAKNLTSIRSIIKPVQYTTGHVLINDLLRQLQANKNHMAVVLDEYGGTAGIITMEDILEELVGEIYDEHDEIVQYFRKLSENNYLVKTDVEVDDFFDYFLLKEDNNIDAITVSGWIISLLKDIPKIGYCFDYRNLNITIKAANSKKIFEIEVVVNDIEIEKNDHNHFNDKKNRNAD